MHILPLILTKVYNQQNEQGKKGGKFEKQDAKVKVGCSSPAAFVLSRLLGAVVQGYLILCQAHVAISGYKIWMLHNFSFCGTSTGCVRALHLATAQKLN